MDSKNVKSVLKTQAKVIAYVVICLVIIVIGISYSLYSDVKHNTTNQVVTAGDLKFTYTDGQEITSSKEVCFNQTNETEASTHTECAYNVTVTNAGSLPGKYNLLLKQKSTTGTHVGLEKLKVILKKDGTKVDGFPKAISSLTSSILTSGTLDAKASTKYSIQVYADEDTITDEDNEKDISLEIEGVAEVNSNVINPAKK